MPIAQAELEAVVAELARRPGHEKVLALLHRLLTGALGARSEQIAVERALPEVRGRVDALLGRTLIEIKTDLRRETPTAEAQLARYLPEREDAISLPVYLGDALQWNVRRDAVEQDHVIAVPPQGARRAGGSVLRFPLGLCADPALFDAVVAALHDASEAGRDADAFVGSLAGLGVPAEDRGTLRATYLTYDRLRRAGRDHVWGFIARNLSRPVALSDGARVDVAVPRAATLRGDRPGRRGRRGARRAAGGQPRPRRARRLDGAGGRPLAAHQRRPDDARPALELQQRPREPGPGGRDPGPVRGVRQPPCRGSDSGSAGDHRAQALLGGTAHGTGSPLPSRHLQQRDGSRPHRTASGARRAGRARLRQADVHPADPALRRADPPPRGPRRRGGGGRAGGRRSADRAGDTVPARAAGDPRGAAGGDGIAARTDALVAGLLGPDPFAPDAAPAEPVLEEA